MPYPRSLASLLQDDSYVESERDDHRHLDLPLPRRPSPRRGVHETGWMSVNTRTSENHEILLGSDKEEKIEAEQEKIKNQITTAEQSLVEAYDLMLAGARRFPDTDLQPGLHITTPNELLTSKEPLTLKPFQVQAVENLVRSIEDQRGGMLLAFLMGSGKTIISIATLTRIPKVEGSPHLLVVPASLMLQWVRELSIRWNPPPSVCVFHDDAKGGTSTSHSVQELRSYDIVVVTYEKLRSDDLKAQNTLQHFINRKSDSNYPIDPIRTKQPLQAITWNVILLDEAHRLSNSESATSQAAGRLRAKARIPITGTPLQNEYSDVQSLIAFLRIEPWRHASIFDRYFMFKQADDAQVRTLAGNINAILALTIKGFALRLKINDVFDGKPVVDYGPVVRNPTRDRHRLLDNETIPQEKTRIIWDRDYRKQRKEQAKRTGEPASDLDYKTLYTAILEARLSIVHPLCLEYRYGELGEADFIVDENHAGLPLWQIQDNIIRTKVTKSSKMEKSRQLLRAAVEQSWSTSRIIKLIETTEHHFKTHGGKILIFSEFLSALDVADVALKNNGYECSRFDGTVDEIEREKIIQGFYDNPTCRIMLITCRAGGLGISLTPANGVIHLTPTWNPALAEQCTHRANRTGQTKTVHVYNLYTHNSIERRVFAKQRQKKLKASMLLDPDQDMKKRMATVSTWSFDQFKHEMNEARVATEAYSKVLEERRLRARMRRKGKGGSDDDSEFCEDGEFEESDESVLQDYSDQEDSSEEYSGEETSDDEIDEELYGSD